jgi:hypothetical protein
MTAPIPTSIVTVEHWDNVTQITWHPVEPPQPPLLTRPAPGRRHLPDAVSAARGWVPTLLALQQCSDPKQADRLLARISDPFTRAVARKDWDDRQAPVVKRDRGGAMALTELSDLIQGSEWLDQRRGMVTASVVGKLVTAKTIRPASNDESRGLTALLVAERITGYTDPVYVSDDMLRGVEDEPGRSRSTASTTRRSPPAGSWCATTGASPSATRRTAGRRRRPGRGQVAAGEEATADDPLRRGAAENMAQLQCGLLVSGRQWIDYVSYSAACRCTSSASIPTSGGSRRSSTPSGSSRRPPPRWSRTTGAATEGLPMTERVIEQEMVI